MAKTLKEIRKKIGPTNEAMPMSDEVDEARMVKLRGRFDPVVKTDAQKMAKHPMYKGNNSKLERDIRKKHGDKNADHFVIQNIIKKHAEMHEDVKAVKQNKPLQKKLDKLYGPKINVLKKGDPRIKAIQTVQAKKKKAFSDLAKKETQESVGKTPGDRSYYNLQKAKELAKKAGHDYDKLPQYDRRHNDHKDYFDNKAKNEDVKAIKYDRKWSYMDYFLGADPRKTK